MLDVESDPSLSEWMARSDFVWRDMLSDFARKGADLVEIGEVARDYGVVASLLNKMDEWNENEKSLMMEQIVLWYIGWGLTDYRKKHGLSRKEIAETLGISESELLEYENGLEQNITYHRLWDICRKLGISMHVQFGTTSNLPETQRIIDALHSTSDGY